MVFKMDLSEILLFLDLIKKEKKRPSLEELKFMLYFLKNYDEVKEFYTKLDENNFNPPFKFYVYSLIHFIEDYEDCVKLKNKVFQLTNRKYSSLFIHQILLCISKEKAISIINEAKKYSINLSETWADRFNSMWQIKIDQEDWRESKRSYEYKTFFPSIYEEFCKKKINYFESLSLSQLKQTLIEKQQSNKNSRNLTQTSVYNRSVYIKEFARRVAKGICQLCDNEAPFQDKQGNPFLEVHHIHYLSKGGSDTIDNVVALCPNCHRKIHQKELEEDVKKIIEKALENMKN